jgi:hypothetical protein
MNKQDLLRNIAETAYNIGFGAKKHFATYDIVSKSPGVIGFLSLAVGVFALVIDTLSAKHISSVLIVLGIAGLYISFYDGEKDEYEKKGILLTQLFNELKALYFTVKSSTLDNFEEDISKLSDIESRYYSSCISKQIIMSDWYAHYKFFWQHQISWVDEQKKFTFWRDRVPLTLSLAVAILLAIAAICIFSIPELLCSFTSVRHVL